MNFLIHQFVDFHARNCPERVAIRFLDERLSYQQLSLASNRLANCLLAHGVRRGDRVGIYMNKCLQTPVALYGIMKAGAAYVPLDPSGPAWRTAEIIADCGIKVLVSDNNSKRVLHELVPQLDDSLVLIGPDVVDDVALLTESWSQLRENRVAQLPDIRILESDLAYIIYTSGSTGQPKGIMHTHHSGLSFARWAVDEYQLLASDRLSNHAPLHFDLSVFDYFAGAVAGATTVIIPEEYTKLPASYSQLIADSAISVLFTVPFALIQLLLRGVLEERDLGALRWVVFGGEPMPVKHLQGLMACLPKTRFDNMYGPAEVNGCSHFTVPSLNSTDTAIPIGRISRIAEARVVDEQFQVVANGEVGELLVRTPTMMQGYWRRPELNKSAFYTSTGESEIRSVFYRTGDLVRQDPDGILWFVGRRDRQVKVRGYRVELDEVESALVAHVEVEEAAVFPFRNDEEQIEILGAVRLRENSACNSDEFLNYLRTRLAWYAIPSGLSIREQFPRTTTGKIDRRALSLGALE